jgi:hypothetical protein
MPALVWKKVVAIMQYYWSNWKQNETNNNARDEREADVQIAERHTDELRIPRSVVVYTRRTTGPLVARVTSSPDTSMGRNATRPAVRDSLATRMQARRTTRPLSNVNAASRPDATTESF